MQTTNLQNAVILREILFFLDQTREWSSLPVVILQSAFSSFGPNPNSEVLLVNDRTVNNEVTAEVTGFGSAACLPRHVVFFEGNKQAR